MTMREGQTDHKPQWAGACPARGGHERRLLSSVTRLKMRPPAPRPLAAALHLSLSLSLLSEGSGWDVQTVWKKMRVIQSEI